MDWLSCYMEVAVKSAPSQRRFSLTKTISLVILGASLAGCGTEIVSYDRDFRQKGFTQYNKQDYVNAAQSFKEALRSEPGDYTSRFYLAECYEVLGHPQQAIEEFRTTLTVMTNSLEGKGDTEMRRKVLYALAQAVGHEPDRTGDLAQLEREPRTPENALLLARIYRFSGDADLAIMRYGEAQQLDPNDPLIAKDYGLYLEQLGQKKKADAELRRAFALNTKDEEVAAALRRLGVVPGPSLKQEDDLEKPFLPVGPLPEVDLSTSSKNSGTPVQPQRTPPDSVGSSSSPRD